MAALFAFQFNPTGLLIFEVMKLGRLVAVYITQNQQFTYFLGLNNVPTFFANEITILVFRKVTIVVIAMLTMLDRLAIARIK
jgi:hypothetical protein